MKMHGHDTHADGLAGEFPTDVAGLPMAQSPGDVELAPGASFDLRIHPVAKRVGGSVVRMLSYNGSIPGPTLRVQQDSEVIVDVTNEGDIDTTVHWHGLRLENRYDGVPVETQAPIAIGGSFTYGVRFPDPGIYWYHPHIREDFAQEMGLYGTIVVVPGDSSYWPPCDREMTITLDDVLMADGRMAPFSRSGPSHTAMGRFGNVMLTNGEEDLRVHAAPGEVVRLYLVNTANTRIFRVGLDGARMKLVGGDSGRYEREEFVEDVVLSPSERAVVDVLFERSGDVRLEHRAPGRVYELGRFTVAGERVSAAAVTFEDLRVAPDLAEERRSLAADLERAPDKTLSFTSSMPLLYGTKAPAGSYVCPMHPEVTETEPSTCPKCGMKLVPAPDPAPAARSYVCPMHPEVTDAEPSTCPKCGMKLILADDAGGSMDAGGHGHGHAATDDGLEWEDLMPEINRKTDSTNMIWKLVDTASGAVNHEIDWTFRVGDRVKIRLVNEMEGSDHPMHHPFHVHGAGRFLVLSRDGSPETNLVWKDTVLLRAGETVDILLHVTSPGLWMAHCHIAEHTESGMMFSFRVEEETA